MEIVQVQVAGEMLFPTSEDAPEEEPELQEAAQSVSIDKTDEPEGSSVLFYLIFILGRMRNRQTTSRKHPRSADQIDFHTLL